MNHSIFPHPLWDGAGVVSNTGVIPEQYNVDLFSTRPLIPDTWATVTIDDVGAIATAESYRQIAQFLLNQARLSVDTAVTGSYTTAELQYLLSVANAIVSLPMIASGHRLHGQSAGYILQDDLMQIRYGWDDDLIGQVIEQS